MRGSIVKRGEHSYSVILELDPDPITKRRRQSWTTVKGTKKDAERRLAELLHQLDNGSFVKPGKSTVAEFLSRWLTEYVRPNLSAEGFERYESVIRVHVLPRVGSLPLSQLKPEHLQQLYSAGLAKGLAARSVRYQHTIVHRALAMAVKWGLLSRNVADAVDPPRANHTEMKTWNEPEIARFLDAARGTAYYSLFFSALFTGARRSELLALRWQDVDLVLGQISVERGLHHLQDGQYIFSQPKSAKSRRTIALTPSTVLMLQDYRVKRQLDAAMLGKPVKDTDLVFSTVEGKPLRPNTISRAWTTLAARCGLKVIRLHDARHTHASLLLKQGTHPKIVQERLGHASIAITLDTYSHVAPGMQEAAAKRFDAALGVGYNEPVESVR